MKELVHPVNFKIPANTVLWSEEIFGRYFMYKIKALCVDISVLSSTIKQ